MDIVTLQKMIDLFGARWTAVENEVSKANLVPGNSAMLGLSFTEKTRMQQMAFARRTETYEPTMGVPPAIDWRRNGGNYVTDVKNQNPCGSCVAFATCATLESRIKISKRDPKFDIDLSEAQLFFCGCGNCCEKGWLPNKALDYAKRGIGLEKDFRYVPSNQPCKSIAPVLKVTSYTAVAAAAARKQAVSARGPVSASMAVYEDFTYYGGGVYKHVTGQLIGYHQVCVVGYDDADQCWIAKNSWGAWGEKGFFRIGYGECGLDTQYPFYDPSVALV